MKNPTGDRGIFFSQKCKNILTFSLGDGMIKM
mgnify:CR=1 FL=1